MTAQSNLIEQRRGGFYWLNGRPFLSVTEILKIIDKPALMYWFGKEVYYAMLQDPTLAERDALAAPYKKSDKAKSRGSTIHSIVEAYKTTGDQIETVPEDLREYAGAFYDFMRDVKPEILFNEKSLVSEKWGIAGTLDMYAKIGDRNFIVDVKTGKDIYMEAGLQMSAYAEMMMDNDFAVDEIAVLLLETGKDGRATGKYKFQTMKRDFKAFRACLAVYKYINAEKLEKVGYQG